MAQVFRNARPLTSLGVALSAILALPACQSEVKADNPPIAVRVTKVALADYASVIRLTGEIQAQVQSDLSFRVGGRVTERLVDVGDHVAAGQVLARLDPNQQQATLTAAAATAAAAEATLRQRKSNFERQEALLAKGFTTKRQHDQAEEAYRAAQASLETARSELGSARDQLSDTVLQAAAPGVITARNIEAGQVVQTAQSAFSIAQDGPRDAVFYVYEQALSSHAAADPAIDLSLVSDPAVTAEGTVREVSPTVDASKGAARVKIGIDQPPPQMTLGAAVVGEARFNTRQHLTVPWSALFSEDGRPAVWTVDPGTKAVTLTPIAIESYETGRVVVRDGLRSGDLVVTAGVQLLRGNQTVAFADGAAL
jgi:RND family efflux transporter MFP subunit